jgi:MFS family permease
MEQSSVKHLIKKGFITSLIVICVSLSFFASLDNVNGQQTLLSDNFTSDTSLNPELWLANGPSGTDFFQNVRTKTIQAGGMLYLVNPNQTFSTEGMVINRVTGPWLMTTIESAKNYSAPLTMRASVTATLGGGAPFCIWLRNDDLPGAVGFNGVLNTSAPNYGIWSDHRGQWNVQRMVPAPQLNIIYDLTITVTSNGEISLSVASNGQTLSTVSEDSIGTGPFKVILSQYEFWSDGTGIGPNQANWKSIIITSGVSNQTPSPSPSPSNTPTPNPTQQPASSPTSEPTTTTSTTTTPTTPPNTPSTTTSPTNKAPNTISTTKNGLTISTLLLLGTATALFLGLGSALFFLEKKKKQTPSTLTLTNSTPNKFFLPGILAAVFSIDIIDIFVPLLRPEIAITFGISTSTAFQLSAFSAIVGVATGLALSFFSIKIRYKTLLLVGVLFTIICTIGVFFAPTFLFAQIFYSFNGAGSVIVSVMAPALIGELYPNNKKARRISWMMVTGQFAIFIGSPITGYIASIGGVTSWRNVLLWFEIPTTILCFVLVFFLVPNKPLANQVGAIKESLLLGFKQILSNKSATALLASGFLSAMLSAVNGFAPAFLAEVFGVTPFLRSLVPITATSLIITGMLIGGLAIHKVGRKKFAVMTALPGNIFVFIGYPMTILFPNIWVLLAFRFSAALVGGMALVAGPVLLLDQVPKHRGTLFSLSSALGGMGLASGFLIGSFILAYFDNPPIGYPAAMTVLGIFGIISWLLLLFFAKDPISPNLKHTIQK